MSRLSVRSRVLVAVAALLMLVLFIVPLWRIQLYAPQYPEGLGMLIRLNTITGLAPTDLANINGLNHYIGMKAIDPEAIPVLRYMPWVVGFLAAFGLVVAVAGRRALLVAWVVAYGVAGAAGLAEFYAWSWDYGHNLAADAVIKVPGMTYQPPLIGTKQLLNFTASSWPAIGGWLAGIAFLIAAAALLPIRGRQRSAMAATLVAARATLIVLVSALVSASACSPSGPPDIAYDRADCDVCRMRITDTRFGGELITRTGKVRQFDSIECLASYAATGIPAKDVRSLWVSDYEHPGHLIDAVHARFIRHTGPGSPMGAGLRAVAVTSVAVSGTPATVLSWSEVAALAAEGKLRADRPSAEPARGS